MTSDSGRPYVDAQTLTNVDTYVYETIATLEYTGKPATRSQIAAVADLDDQVLDESLSSLVDRSLIVQMDARDGEPAFEPAERGWSTAPDQAQGM
jgi:hypothetical protein